MRQQLGVKPNQILVGFSGKLTPKKDPLLVVEALYYLRAEHGDRFSAVFVGDGELAEQLMQATARNLNGTVAFSGFVNQSKIVDYYLAMDILVLPSRRRGETWGLVVNEALHAGCAVAISEAVGCHVEFGKWERVRVVPVGDALRLAAAIEDLSQYERDFTWCEDNLTPYTVQAVASALESATRCS
jgi:glycosyltransferase involved in cell wall biosynthesis